MAMSPDQNAEQNHNIKTDNESFERVEQFKYLGTANLNQNSIHEETEYRLSHELLAVVWCKVFCHPVCCPKI
jgi:hypothetical protein